jgi:hypothetical protein
VVYVDGAGLVFNNPAADGPAVINTPGGGNSRNVRRPDLVPASTRSSRAAAALPEPGGVRDAEAGTFGNLERGALHGPSFAQVDLVVSKHFRSAVRATPSSG